MLDKNDNLIWEPSNLYGLKIGKHNNIGAFCDLAGRIGNNCKIQTHVSLPPLTVVEDDVFLGPGVRVANDPNMNGNLKGTLIKTGAKVGMGALIMAGVTIGKYSVIGMGSVVLQDVPDGETWVGNPARKIK